MRELYPEGNSKLLSQKKEYVTNENDGERKKSSQKNCQNNKQPLLTFLSLLSQNLIRQLL